MKSPKICMLYYKNILDGCILDFFGRFGDMFVRGSDGQYVFSGEWSRERAYGVFQDAVKQELARHVKTYDMAEPEHYFIIGGCSPADNIMLKHRKDFFPARLDRFISEKNLKYVLSEEGILIDQWFFNRMFDDIFDAMFRRDKNAPWPDGRPASNLFFIRHARLDCYAVFKIIKKIYGNINCVNIYMTRMQNSGKAVPLRSVNDMIDVYSKKREACASREFAEAAEEVRSYCDRALKGGLDG